VRIVFCRTEKLVEFSQTWWFGSDCAIDEQRLSLRDSLFGLFYLEYLDLFGVGKVWSDGAISPATVLSRTMSSFVNGASPMRQAVAERESDIEAGPATHRSTDLEDGDLSDPFDIARTKNASIERLRRWRVCFLFWFIFLLSDVLALFYFCLCFSFFIFCLFLCFWTVYSMFSLLDELKVNLGVCRVDVLFLFEIDWLSAIFMEILGDLVVVG